MSLKFLEKDDRVSYIADAWEERQKLRPVCDKLYKTRKRPGVLVIDIQNAFTLRILHWAHKPRKCEKLSIDMF